MKLTKQQLKQIIKEELEKVLNEGDPDIAIYKGQGPDVPYSGPSRVDRETEEVITKYAAQSRDHGDIITRVLKVYLATGRLDDEAYQQLDDYGKDLFGSAIQELQDRGLVHAAVFE